MPTRHVVVPLKDFSLAKSRLRNNGHQETEAMVRQLATAVVRACAPQPCTIVTESLSVRAFAEDLGISSLLTTATDLNGAVSDARDALRATCEQLIVVHGDLRNPSGLGSWEPGPGVTIVTDHHGTGTNVLALDCALPFTFFYGPDSAARHELEARRLEQTVSIIRTSPWAFDIDELSDLEK